MALGSKTLSGPRLPPARGPATHLVVLCHGYGADGNDLIGLAPRWQRLLPTVAFSAPNAPEPVPGAPSGYQWFPIQRLDPGEMQRGVESASDLLNIFLDAELARHELPPDRLALVGFSQGTMMSLQVGLRRPVKPAAIVGYSGMLARGTELEPLPPDTPPILMVHGSDDPMIPAQAMLASVGMLGGAGAAVQWHISPGVGHGIDPQGLELGGGFLSAAFRGLLRRRESVISSSVP
ncbi:MAG: dienelactone hydrolase family protein [Alphaproteobacteria bacterium]|nr:dienelactone hydrolase family protein [Alphaproteobacteria bacterium]MBL6938885.1 dienelactone hydrolase family protein [Alphaproteobacteria bacterium]MBL7099477.1 dienelactone hydrolase family protein [Alphaproteobacteria bacterium]